MKKLVMIAALASVMNPASATESHVAGKGGKDAGVTATYDRDHGRLKHRPLTWPG